MRKYLFTYMACLLMLLSGLAACSSDGDAPDTGGGGASKTFTVHFTLSPASPSSDGTRSDGSRSVGSRSVGSRSVGSADENMKSWVVVFVGSDGKVVTSVENKNVADNNRIKDEVSVSGLTAGRYTVYSFANIPASELNITKGQPVDFDSKAWAVNGNDFDPTPQGIPMSNKQTVTIGTDGNPDISDLWVVRMLSKITLKFRNLSSSNITVNSVSISDITSNPSSGGGGGTSEFSEAEGGSEISSSNSSFTRGDSESSSSGSSPSASAANVMLLPGTLVEDGKTVQKAPNLAGKAPTSEFTHTIENEGLTVAKGTSDYDTSDDGEHCVSFYVNESKAGNTYPYFVVTLETSVGTQRYFMYTDWNQIARNDHHVLKLALSDYKLRLKVEGYSAIGMLPSLEDDGKQLNLTFHMPDEEFHIIPSVTKYSDTSDTPAPVKFTDVEWKLLEESETGAEQTAFSAKPAKDTRTDYIEGVTRGELGKKIGPIIYQLSCKVNTGTASELTLVYRVALTQDLSWYSDATRSFGSSDYLKNIQRKFYRYE